jgi:hypothetical protein
MSAPAVDGAGVPPLPEIAEVAREDVVRDHRRRICGCGDRPAGAAAPVPVAGGAAAAVSAVGAVIEKELFITVPDPRSRSHRRCLLRRSRCR